MELAANKYKNLRVNGKWNAPTPNEEKILALQAEVRNLRKNNRKVKFQEKGKMAKIDHPNEKKRKSREMLEWITKRPTDANLHKPKE